MTDAAAEVSEFLNDDARAAIAKLADIVIPAFDGRPSASDVGVHSRFVDGALRARPDLIGPLRAAVESVGLSSADPEAVREQLPEGLVELFLVCYFMSPVARRAIDYPGQASVRVADGEAEYYLEEGDVLAPVLSRGPRWRAVPDA